MANILVVDDEEGQRGIVAKILHEEGHRCRTAESVKSALSALAEETADVVLTDYKMDGGTGIDLVRAVKQLAAPPEIVVMTAFGTIDTAVAAMKAGAYDYLSKPLEREELLLVVTRAAEKRALRAAGEEFRSRLVNDSTTGLIAESKGMRDVLDVVDRICASDATVLIRGETGTGKERIAKLIHYKGPRGVRPIFSVNCAAFPETLLESELFGYEKGSFTGAAARKIGIVESASGSTLFLDEIGDMPLSVQAKVLRVIQEKEVRRVGAVESIPVDIRIIAATHRNLAEMVKSGTFREDLYYRLNVIPITVPPLYERPDDIIKLTGFFLSRSGTGRVIPPDTMKALCSYRWPGNVRELEAVVLRMALLSRGNEISISDLPPEIVEPPVSRVAHDIPTNAQYVIPSGGIVFEDFERDILRQALDRGNGVYAEAARLLGMTYRTFQYRAEKFGLAAGTVSQ